MGDKDIPSLFDNSDDGYEQTRAAEDLRLQRLLRPADAWLLVVGGQRCVGKLFRLRGKQTIGRAPPADLILDEEGVSRSHALVEVVAGGVLRVSDLQSSNGIRVGGRLVKVHSLRGGERLRLGDAVLTLVQLDTAPQDVVAANLRASADLLLADRGDTPSR
ncbi:MAG TPA: FHA domain-containing protein [Labilithrix sp.]|nr:FHA domain-containing protein [Labilithrix sp.]